MEKKNSDQYLKISEIVQELKNITNQLHGINKALTPEKKIDWNTPLMYAILGAGLIFALYFMQKIMLAIGL